MAYSRGFRILFSCAVLALATPAKADLASEAELVAASWEAHTGHATRLSPVFLEFGRPLTISIPKSAQDPKSAACTSIAFITERSTDFIVRVDPIEIPKHRSLGGHAERSNAGVIHLVRCGKDKSSLARLSVELRVARASLEVVVAEGTTKAPPVAAILKERASGPLAPLTDAGPPPSLEPLDIRLSRAEARARKTGASHVRKLRLTPSFDGRGQEILQVEEGCHLIELFAESLGPGRLDLDAEARDSTTERLLARDRSDSPDARLELCVGTQSPLKLAYAGAQGAVDLFLTDAVFPIPSGVPSQWGPRARAGMAAALRRRKVAEAGEAPQASFLGVMGPTHVPVELEPGACYLAAVAASRGEMRFLTLSAQVDGRTSFDSNAGLFDGTAVSFCIERQARAALEVDARGRAVAWVMALWKTGSITLGDER